MYGYMVSSEIYIFVKFKKNTSKDFQAMTNLVQAKQYPNVSAWVCFRDIFNIEWLTNTHINNVNSNVKQ